MQRQRLCVVHMDRREDASCPVLRLRPVLSLPLALSGHSAAPLQVTPGLKAVFLLRNVVVAHMFSDLRLTS